MKTLTHGLLSFTLFTAHLLYAGTSVASEETEELGPYMARLQTYSQKLGLSIRAENLPLSQFYLEEIEEVLEEVEERFPVFEEKPIAQFVKQTAAPAVSELEHSLKADGWKERVAKYEAVIASCNTCHTASDHGFIVVTPAGSENPFNQSFEVSP